MLPVKTIGSAIVCPFQMRVFRRLTSIAIRLVSGLRNFSDHSTYCLLAPLGMRIVTHM